MSQRIGDLQRRRRLAGGVHGQWYSYWRTVRLSLRLFGARVAVRPFTYVPPDATPAASSNHPTA